MNEAFRYDTPPFWEAKYYGHFSMPQIALINWAIAFAFSAHIDTPVRKADGSPYINHPIRMTRIAMDELHIYDVELIVTLLLHDVKEVSKNPFINIGIGMWFGAQHDYNVDQLTKTSENKKTYIDDMKKGKVWRVILAKLIDRLDNMQTLQGMDTVFQTKQAKETREVFLDLCDELEDVIPKEYNYIPSLLHDRLKCLCEQYGC